MNPYQMLSNDPAILQMDLRRSKRMHASLQKGELKDYYSDRSMIIQKIYLKEDQKMNKIGRFIEIRGLINHLEEQERIYEKLWLKEETPELSGFYKGQYTAYANMIDRLYSNQEEDNE